MKQENKNFLYNAVYQMLIFIIPFVLTPYISRVLGVSMVGVYSYTYSIISYFMLFSMLGINNYASRKIAKCSENTKQLNYTFCSIYYFQLITFFITFLIYIVFLIFFQYDQKNIMFVQSLFLISSLFDINWLFFGLEKFKITVSRNIIIKLLSMILVFIFVKTPNDLWKYTLIMSGSTLLSQLYLWIFLKKEITLVRVLKKDILSNLKPCLILFIPVISYSIYRVMDKTMIGAIASSVELGNYESAEKITNIPMSFVTALGTVMLPHMSKISLKDIEKNIYSSFELSFFIVCPMFVCLEIIAGSFSNIFFGSEFTEAGNIIRILMVTTIFSAISNVVRTNYLIPAQKDTIYVKSTIYGAIVNLIFNSLFIRKYGAYGACIGTIAAELILMIYQSYNARDTINFLKVFKIFLKYLMISIVIGVFVLLLEFSSLNDMLKLILQIIVAVVLYFILNYKYIIYDFFGRKKVSLQSSSETKC